MSKRKEQQEKLAEIWAKKSAGAARRNLAASENDIKVDERLKEATDRKSATPLSLLSDALINVTESKTLSTVVDEVVVIPSENCLPSFARDRFEFAEDPDFISLKESIKESGQQLPILVRPHPEKHQLYQIAFGHRRHRACQELGFPVRAVVREMSDEALVIAQGTENNEREDLTFIEIALFASHLGRDFPRSVVMSAIGKKSQQYVSMLRTVTAALPEELIKKIGKAKGIGRPRWESLASYFNDGQLNVEAPNSKKLEDELDILLKSDAFKEAQSPKRFELVMNFLKRSTKPEKARQNKRILKTQSGNTLAEVVLTDDFLRLTVQRKSSPEFADYLGEHLDRLIAEFEAKGERS